MSTYNTRGEAIRDLRQKSGLSQEELAKALGTTKQTIYKYEAGIVTNIPSDKIETMSKIFHVSPAIIMGWDSQIGDDGEAKLLENFRQLNEEGREKLIDYSYDLTTSGRYKKHNQPEILAEEKA